MKILLTGATGYIGKRLLPLLAVEGNHVICCVRDKQRFHYPDIVAPFIEIVEVDFLESESLSNIPNDFEFAYYLMHSMSAGSDFQASEALVAKNFKEYVSLTNCRQTIYLSGITNDEYLSDHLSSRKNVEHILSNGKYHLTTLRAGIVVGSGSASFEIIRDLVEKLPIMIAPKWLNTRCQPIGIRDVMKMLSMVLSNKDTYGETFDIGGSDVLTYKEMLLKFAEVRGLKRYIYTVPIMTPRLSSYWLYFVTSTTYPLACALVDSMNVEVVAKDSRINEILNITPESYDIAVARAFERVVNNQVISSWKDSFVGGISSYQVSDYVEVPTHGCFIDRRIEQHVGRELATDKIWRIGGDTGWYAANYLWKLRGYLDKLIGGVGLRRGRTNSDSINSGDVLDFWRVLYADREEGRLLLFAEMKLPGDAWLEFKVLDDKVVQTATFRPKGILGRLYWYSVVPLHGIVFNGMLSSITNGKKL